MTTSVAFVTKSYTPDSSGASYFVEASSCFVEDDALGRSNCRPGNSVSLCRCYWGSVPLTNWELDLYRPGVTGEGRRNGVSEGWNETRRQCSRAGAGLGGGSEERFVDAHVAWSLVAPGKLPFHTLSTLPPHLGPLFGVVEKLKNRTGKSVRVVGRRVQRSRPS